MPCNTSRRSASELWAATDIDGHILYGRGGSSSAPKLLVYPSKKKAEAALRNPWICKIMWDDQVVIKRIYKAKED